jgi:hypothetical protein
MSTSVPFNQTNLNLGGSILGQLKPALGDDEANHTAQLAASLLCQPTYSSVTVK